MGSGRSTVPSNTGGGVRQASASSILIDFYYRGVRCKEFLRLPPTKANMKYAESVRAQILSEMGRGTFNYAKFFPNSRKALTMSQTPGTAITVADQLRLWLRGMKDAIQHTTFRDYELAIEKVWIPSFGDYRLTEVTRGMLKAWVGDQACGLKRVRNLLLPMRGMFEQAMEDELITANPFVGWTPRKASKPKEEDDIDPFSQEEIRAILDHCDGQVRNFIQFAFWTGMRTSELIALRWSDVDWSSGTIAVKRAKVRRVIKAPKTAAGRRLVTLLPGAMEALKDQRQYTQLRHMEIFHNPRTGEPWDRDAPIRKTAWIPALERAGVRYRYPYQTRHTFASTMLSAGEHPMWVANQMGHRDWSMIIKVYGRWIPSIDPSAGKKAASLWPAP